MKADAPKTRAFTLVEIMIVVAIIALLAAIALPNFIRARARAQANACINNLRVINDAASQFAVENNKNDGDSIRFPRDLKPFIRLNVNNRIPACPAGGKYLDFAVGEIPICSLGNSVDPAHIMP